MTENNKTYFELVADFGNLYTGYQKAKAGKGSSASSQKFQTVALDGIHQLKRRLETKTYQIAPYNKFLISDPKERIIEAGSFHDKIVQNSLCDNALLPILQAEFIKNNFAGQIGKGTLYGLNHLRDDMLKAYNKYGMDCWIIKGDVRKFYYSIDHEILKDILRYFVSDDDVYWLCEQFVDSKDGLGVPLGNRTGQIFCLLMLSGFDHFVSGELGVDFYGRYSDDFYMIVQSKSYALECLEDTYAYMDTLKLKLNGKTQLIPFSQGVCFCGFHTYVTEDGKVIRKLLNDKKRSAKKKYCKMAKLVRDGKLDREKFDESFNSYLNHISHGNCIKLAFELETYVKSILGD